MTNREQLKNVAHSELKQLVDELGRELVAKVARRELPMFRAQSAAYHADPKKALSEHAGKDEMLGFGVGDAPAFLTPVILAAATAAIQFLAEQVKESLQTESSDLIKQTVKCLFAKFRQESTTVPPLTSAQLAQVREITYQKVRQMGRKDNDAKLIADALVGSLALAPSTIGNERDLE